MMCVGDVEKKVGNDRMWRDDVTNENVIRLWACASNLEEFHQVEELAVDVAADLFQVSRMRELVGANYLRLLGRPRPGHYFPRQGFLWL